MSVMADADMNKVAASDSTPTATEEKQERVLLVELKNGKPVFKQKSLAFHKMSETLQETVKFREMLEQRIEAKDTPLKTIPDEHKPLIAKLVHESDKTLQALSKHIQHELLPAQDEDDEDSSSTVSAALPLDVIEKAIKSVASRSNYGLDASEAPNGRVPAAWQIWRWEVKDELIDWLPKALLEKVRSRLAERQQLKRDVATLFSTLADADRNAILGTKSSVTGKLSNPKEKRKVAEEEVTIVDLTTSQSSSAPPAKREAIAIDDDKNEAQDGTPGKKNAPGRPKKPVDPEKAAKEKERQEKRQAKLDREKKAKEAQDKSRNLMASFFGKPKAPVASGSGSRSGSIHNDATDAEESKPKEVVSGPPEFERTFRPFTLKKDAELAPHNWFSEVKSGKGKGISTEVIVIEDDHVSSLKREEEDVVMQDTSAASEDPDRGQMTAEDRLRESFSSLHPSLRPPLLPLPPRRHPRLRTYHSHTVRAMMQDLTEAELTGDVPAVRSILSRLRNRSLLPAKVLIFHEDARPGYFGTWTRSSKEVGPRTPFSRDVVSLDYGVDSGEEWEEEEEGDVLGNEDEDEEGAATEEVDSDLDSWLVDDDEVVDPGTPVDERLGSPDFFPPPLPKRKAKEPDDGEGRNDGSKKRKVVVPLVAFTKGPCWESAVGHCTYEPFNSYKIQFFNDAPFPIDPFKFVSLPATDASVAKSQSAQAPSGFAVPSLPVRLSNSSIPTSSSVTMSPLGSVNGAQPKRPLPPPKTSFPDAHMPFLIAKIRELDTGNMTFIVESVYKDLKKQMDGGKSSTVKKNAIEAKVKEVTEKEKKIWVVRSDVKTLYGAA
ncbi:hypothetical protein BDW22DRAFT_1359974 [Trametopsis cervina]|nr:hypothetical protein BDW22DRAFT_1359974 [Trametopsis cervina]